jgi:hypothetical protein
MQNCTWESCKFVYYFTVSQYQSLRTHGLWEYYFAECDLKRYCQLTHEDN